MIDAELDLLTDVDQHLFIEEGIRERVPMGSHQYTQVNVPDIENYNASKRNSYIMYFYTSNLYGWTMLQPLLWFQMAHRQVNGRIRFYDGVWWEFKAIYFQVWFG